MVNIPAGVEDGSRIRLSSEGEAGTRGGPNGDLLIDLTVEKHPLFTREEDNLIYELPVNFAQAALGTEVEVPTLDGTAKIKIQAGSQNGAIFRLKGKGVTHLRSGGRGDVYYEGFCADAALLAFFIRRDLRRAALLG
jgi:molecular chaperone DnaJ